jgi:hypothetical protein
LIETVEQTTDAGIIAAALRAIRPDASDLPRISGLIRRLLLLAPGQSPPRPELVHQIAVQLLAQYGRPGLVLLGEIALRSPYPGVRAAASRHVGRIERRPPAGLLR